MKKLALLFCGLGSLAFLSASAATYTTTQSEPQYQEQCVPAPCNTDTVCNQLPCNVPVNCNTPQNCNTVVNCATPVTCTPDTVCNPAPCNVPTQNNTTAQNNNTYNGCC